MITFQALRHELRPTVRLGLPLVLAEMGWMSMGIVDTISGEEKSPPSKTEGGTLAEWAQQCCAPTRERAKMPR